MKKKSVRLSPELEKYIVLLKGIDGRSALMDRSGRLLWSSVKWKQDGPEKGGWGQALGFNWLEFVALSDVPNVESWVKSDEEHAIVTFATEHNSIPGRWLITMLQKWRQGPPDVWTVVGGCRKAPPCAIPERDPSLTD